MPRSVLVRSPDRSSTAVTGRSSSSKLSISPRTAASPPSGSQIAAALVTASETVGISVLLPGLTAAGSGPDLRRPELTPAAGPTAPVRHRARVHRWDPCPGPGPGARDL